MNVKILIYLLIVCASVFLILIRLLLGPDASNRTVALDVITTVFAALFVVFGFVFKRGIYLDVALVYAIISFVGVLVVARFLERGI